ncbi:hypothetical protein DFH09DRAFT_965188 [Mycena vulgaris]|nr:hypothetical protein DFH09DRAFT_965188 [Mycena vulgaris]
MADVCKEFTLNVEQERAFTLVMVHASSKQPVLLKMYLGGMGREVTSQGLIDDWVHRKKFQIHVITKFFKLCNESYRFMVIGPTGSTTVLVNGSTLPFRLQSTQRN